ncbi:hypothetical protein CMV_026335 [Castanea mollissima]|uniref:Sugar phosphate transporter domain-containing protein n=1 Tax=Castanea mollissima TaxID=60419 RepID=A0A8J4V7N9_9ROSI|nr:hypothetical protein CMV_026335 [Castanea mollissima]
MNTTLPYNNNLNDENSKPKQKQSGSSSSSLIVYNKYILDRKLYNWPFPISLTMIHMSFCSFLAYLLVKVFKVVELPSTMTRDLYLKYVVPIGALYSLSLWFSNSTYIYLSVSFIQMLKALMSFVVYSIRVLYTGRGENKGGF